MVTGGLLCLEVHGLDHHGLGFPMLLKVKLEVRGHWVLLGPCHLGHECPSHVSPVISAVLHRRGHRHLREEACCSFECLQELELTRL